MDSKELRRELKKILWEYFSERLDTKIEIERRKVNEEFSLLATDYSKVNTGKNNEINRSVEIFNLKKDLAERRLKQLELLKKNLQSALSTLNQEEYELLELSYCKENYTIREVAANLCLAESTVANKKRELLDQLMEILGMVKEYRVCS
jgi:DNA-directed RNA polymerase specialized sigma subunit